MEITRKCYISGELIKACNGFVIAGDFLEFMEGKRKFNNIREVCGKCILKYDKQILKDLQKEREYKNNLNI